MNIRIHINKLGPIRDSEIELKPLMVFTGMSGLGKSYTAFLIYYLVNSISNLRLIKFIAYKWRSIEKDKPGTVYSFKISELRKWLNDGVSSYIGYLIGNSNFECDVNYIFDIDDDFMINMHIEDGGDNTSILRINEKYASIFPSGVPKPVIVCVGLYNYLSPLIFRKSQVSAVLLPPARGAFVGAESVSSSIGMYKEFANQLNNLKTPPSDLHIDQQFFASITKKIAGGNIITENGNLLLEIPGDKPIPISAAASSVKELAPFLLLLRNGDTIRNYSVLFEEPEAHVHPLKQYIVMDAIARCVNKGMSVQLTTHSDYFLSRMNQLIRIGNIKKKDATLHKEFCQKTGISDNLFIDSDKVGAYFFAKKDNKVVISKQEASQGLAFSTFDKIVNDQMNISSDIIEYAQRAGLNTLNY